MRKVATDIGKPCNKIITNYCYNIAQNYQGYITGIPVAYSSDKDFTAIQEVLNYNDVKNEDSELLRNALIFGRAFEINYIDEDGKQRFKVLDSREVIPVYDTTLNNDLLYIIRYYLVDNVGENLEDYYVEVYTATTIRIYRSSQNFTSFSLLDERLHHY
jgi:SPP1 family phage portal protein